jgi:hypothetical protein
LKSDVELKESLFYDGTAMAGQFRSKPNHDRFGSWGYLLDLIRNTIFEQFGGGTTEDDNACLLGKKCISKGD